MAHCARCQRRLTGAGNCTRCNPRRRGRRRIGKGWAARRAARHAADSATLQKQRRAFGGRGVGCRGPLPGLTVGSYCAGIGAVPLALRQLGIPFRSVFAAEINPGRVQRTEYMRQFRARPGLAARLNEAVGSREPVFPPETDTVNNPVGKCRALIGRMRVDAD